MSLTKRLAIALLAILFVFGLAVLIMRLALGGIADAEAEVVALDRMKHASQLIAAEVREQALHQAHMLLSLDLADMPEYEVAVGHTRAALVQMLAGDDDDRRHAEPIVELAVRSDRLFRDAGIRALRSGDRARVREVSDHLEAIVDDVVKRTDELARVYDARAARSIARAERTRQNASRLMMICFGLAFALAAFAGLWLARSVVRPVAALMTGARKVGAGDLEARIRVTGVRELVVLADVFNQMTADLSRNQDALVRSQKLAAIGQLAAGVAHEINNPLSVILGYAKLLRRAPGEANVEELQAIEDEARQCQRIVQELLDLARPQHLERADVELGALVRSQVTRLRDSGLLEGHAVNVSEPATRVLARVDELKLGQVVSNLVLNAVQATPPEGAISVDVAAATGSVTIDVRDTGSGISADALPRVFEPFFTTKRRGTGLGLAIAQAIVDAHGGRLQIDTAPQRGTCVRVTLPAAKEGPDS